MRYVENSTYVYISPKDEEYFHLYSECPKLPRGRDTGRASYARIKFKLKLCPDCKKEHDEIFPKNAGCAGMVLMLFGAGWIISQIIF
jgi:hypothetical protein